MSKLHHSIRGPLNLWVRIASLSMALALTGCVDSIEHNEVQAAKKAEEFVEIAFVRNDSERAYGLLAAATKRYVPPEQFKRVLARLHPQGSPKAVRAIEYEPMKGEKAIYIYLAGEHSGEHFYYRITLEGTAAGEYRVLKFERSLEPYAVSPERKKINR
jgi:hypothetical protein